MRALLSLALLAALSPALAQEAPPAVPVEPPLSAVEARREAERLALLRGFSDDATLAPDAAKVAEIQEALAAVRRLEPSLRSFTLRFMGPADDALLIGYDASLLGALTAAYQGAPHAPLRGRRPAALHLPELDAAAAALGASFELEDAYGTLTLRMRFGRAVDLDKAAARVRAQGVTFVQPERLLVPDYPVLVDADPAGGWRVTLSRGWGDCMAGCINKEYWYFTVRRGVARRAGHLRRVYDAKTNAYRESGVKAWDPAPPR